MKLKKIVVFLGIALFLMLLFLGGGIAYLTAMEYRPEEIEEVSYEQRAEGKLTFNDEILALSWNIGYSALGEKADFFMDGGKMVRGFSKEDIQTNLEAMIKKMNEENPDIILLQEVDREAYRSYYVNQVEEIKKAISDKTGTFANNFKCQFIPYPIPPIRDVDAGILSLNRYEVNSSRRMSLPVSFDWPVSVVNLKRCLLVDRIPIEDSEKELVLVNLHLEAYDNGEGKTAQTKALMKLLKEEYEKGNYVVAGGDFNQTFSGIGLESIENIPEGEWKPEKIEVEAYQKEFEFLMDSSTPTCRSLAKPYEPENKDFCHYFIDGFIVSKNIEVKEVKTVDLGFKHTDHNPVLLKFKLK